MTVHKEGASNYNTIFLDHFENLRMLVSLLCLCGVFVISTCYIFLWYAIGLSSLWSYIILCDNEEKSMQGVHLDRKGLFFRTGHVYSAPALLPQVEYSTASYPQGNHFVGSNFILHPPHHFLSLDPLLIISCYIFIKIWKIIGKK